MERREFCSKAAFTMAGLMAASPMASKLSGQQEGEKAKTKKKKQRRYEFEIEIYEARKDTWCHKKGEKFKYPQDMDKICPWLLSSMWDFIRVLQHGATLSWKYKDTPYEKLIDPDGVTTEFVRCPDPTADLVAKITRTAVYV